MTSPAPLPLGYGKGRSFVDPARIRWGGAGDLLLAGIGILIGLELVFDGGWRILTGLLVLAIGAGFGWLGVMTWKLTKFGQVGYHALQPDQRLIVKIASVGYLFLLLLMALWALIKKIASVVLRWIRSRQSSAQR